jgi:tetratricopeptide (TPR) repeat protein
VNTLNNDIKGALQQGMAFFQSGRLPQAEQVFRSVLSKEPREVNALQLLGLTVFQQGRPQEGEKLLRKAIRRSPKIAKLHFNLGHMLEMQGKLKEALFAFREAVKLDPKDEWIQVNLGVVYGKLNRVDEALDACRAALKINPENISALSNMGHLLWRNGKTEEAIATLERALEIKPDMVEALANLGGILFGEKRLSEAEAHLRRAYELNPRNGEVLNNLAGALIAQDKGDEALPLSRQAMEQFPNSPEACFNLGRVAQQAEQWEEAITAYSRGLELQPDTPDAMGGLAEAYGVMGRFDEAKKLYYRTLELKPDALGSYAGLLSLEDRAVMRDELGKIEGFYQSPHTDERGKRHLAFALAKFLEKEGEYEKAFQYLDEGNRMKREDYEYGLEEDQEMFDLIKSVFNESFFEQRAGYGVEDSMPIFILGMPRSGTTLTEQILASHPQVFGAGELNQLKQQVKQRSASVPFSRYAEAVADWERSDFDKLAGEYLEYIRGLSQGEERVTDKMPHNFLLLGLVSLVLPKAKVIHCRRNPVDNCLSIFKQDFSSMHKYAYDLTELGGYYCLYEDLMQYWHQVLPEGFIFDLQYEEMVADQEGMTRKLLEFCGLPWDDSCLSFHETERAVRTASQTQVRKKIYKDSVQLWQRYEQQLQPLIKALGSRG